MFPYYLNCRNFFLFTLLQCVIVRVNSDMDFTYSASDLYRLIQTEENISKQFDQLTNTISNFQHVLESFKNSATLLNQLIPDNIIKNPLISYKLVKRHGKELQVFDQAIQTFVSELQEMLNKYLKLRTTFTKPSEKDTEYAMEAIIRLRQTYNFTVDEISRGKLGNLQIEGSLSSEDLAHIGLYSKKTKMVANSRLFLEAALKQNKKNADLATGYENWVEQANLALTVLNSENRSNSKGDREDFRVLTEMDTIFAIDSLENLNSAFEDLCQNYAVKDPPISILKCYLDKTSRPIRKISPLKIEVYHEDPQLIVIYDFMSDKEIDEIEAATFYKLKRSLTSFFIAGKMQAEPSIIRTTSQTWIYDLGHPTFGYLSKRIESVTGYYLSGEHSAEELQIASYRPGGHYSLHTDATREEVLEEFIKPEDIVQGDRIATFMIYMSDVEMGGNTAFPMLNISVRPVKGSAVLWGNLYPDGRIARNTMHGACPVVYGVKNSEYNENLQFTSKIANQIETF